MNSLIFILADLKSRAMNAVLAVLLLSISVGTLLSIAHIQQKIDNKIAHDVHGIDLVVSNKGSPLQIILSSIFHADIPTGNIEANIASSISAHPLIKRAIPMALGDNYNGARIVGTTHAYLDLYGAEIGNGKIFDKPMEAVIGYDIASKYHLQLGDNIIGSHGLVGAADLHSDHPYKVVGILKPSNKVTNHLILTALESVWHLHEDHEAEHDETTHLEADHHHEDRAEIMEGDITSLLIQYKSPVAALQLPKFISEFPNVQVANPAVEAARLNRLFNNGSAALKAFALLFLLASTISIFIVLSANLEDRKYEMALLRVLGLSRAGLAKLALLQVSIICCLGVTIGFILNLLFQAGVAYYIKSSAQLEIQPLSIGMIDLITIIFVLAMSLLAAIIPVIRIYQINLTKILAQS